MEGPRPATLIQDAILQLCKELKNDAVSLVDAVALPDFILNSVLGASDGLVSLAFCNKSFIFFSEVKFFAKLEDIDIIDYKCIII